jgi:hypothetical protein
MTVAYPSRRDLCGHPPIQSTLNLSLPDRGYNYGLSPATARVWADHDLCAVAILYEDTTTGEAWQVTLSPNAAIDFALAIARVAGELDAGDAP